MDNEETVLGQIRSLRELFDERTGPNGMGGDIRGIKDCLQEQNGRVRENTVCLAKLDVHQGVNAGIATKALDKAQSIEIDAAKTGGKWGAIGSAAVLIIVEVLRNLPQILGNS